MEELRLQKHKVTQERITFKTGANSSVSFKGINEHFSCTLLLKGHHYSDQHPKEKISDCTFQTV